MMDNALAFRAFKLFVKDKNPRAIARELNISRWATYRLKKKFDSGSLFEQLRRVRLTITKDSWNTLRSGQKTALILSSK